MTAPDVNERRGALWWMWAILAVLLAGLAFWFFMLREESARELSPPLTDTVNTAAAAGTNPAAEG